MSWRAALSALAVGGALLAKTAPAFAQPTPPNPPGAQAQDAMTFLTAAYSAAQLQGEAGRLAADKGSDAVKEFARTNAATATRQIEQLKAFAQDKGLALPPPGMLLEHQAQLQGLQPLEGKEFDLRYAQMEVQALEQEKRIYARSGPSGAALPTPPDLDARLAQAQQLVTQIRG